MAVRTVSLDSMRERRVGELASIGNAEQRIPYLMGEHRNPSNPLYATKRVVNGELMGYELTKPVGEMITTAAGRRELLEKVVLDVEIGRERVPLLYAPIYERLQDANFPEVFDAPWAQYGVVVFLQHMEGEEIKFGHIQAEEGPTARIVTYAAGFEFTEKMVLFNQTFSMDMLETAFGEAYNALLNHVHLFPIFDATYTSDNQTDAVYTSIDGEIKVNKTGAHPMLSIRETLKQGISDTRNAKRPGNILLCASVNEVPIQEALARLYVRGTDYPPIGGISQIISYDGWSVQVGRKTHSYAGVPSDKVWLIRPRRGFKELVKHDLMIDAGDGDLSRLVETQVVGRAYRGTYAALAENVQEITLPDFS